MWGSLSLIHSPASFLVLLLIFTEWGISLWGRRDVFRIGGSFKIIGDIVYAIHVPRLRFFTFLMYQIVGALPRIVRERGEKEGYRMVGIENRKGKRRAGDEEIGCRQLPGCSLF